MASKISWKTQPSSHPTSTVRQTPLCQISIAKFSKDSSGLPMMIRDSDNIEYMLPQYETAFQLWNFQSLSEAREISTQFTVLVMLLFEKTSKFFIPLAPTMNQSTVLDGWFDLPQELLDLVARNLTSCADYVRVRAVCSSWRSNLPKKPPHFLTQLPWLLLPHFINNTTMSETHCSFFNLADSEASILELPEIIGKGKRCWGSPHGWLVILHEDSLLFSLLNPLTKAQIQLPTFVLSPSDLKVDQILLHFGLFCGFHIEKAILFANPSVSTDFVVVIILKEGWFYGLAFFRSGDVAWNLVTDTSGIIFEDVVCLDGCIYAVDYVGTVYVCYLGDSSTVIKIADPPEELEEDEPEEKYLVECSRGLLLVYRYHVELRDNDPTYYFTVHKLDLSTLKWSQVDDLGDQVLFLGSNCSFALSARHFRSCKGNSIYYTDDTRCPIDCLEDSKSNNDYIKGHDLGVFNLDEGSVDHIPGCPIACALPACGLPACGLPGCPLPSSYDIKYMFPSPVWVTLSP